jgi:hypothetical protein
MLVGMAVRDQPAAPLGLREMVGRSWLNQRIGQDLLEGLARYIARRERAIERVSGVAANRLDTCGMKRTAVECSQEVGASSREPTHFSRKVSLPPANRRRSSRMRSR